MVHARKMRYTDYMEQLIGINHCDAVFSQFQAAHIQFIEFWKLKINCNLS